MYADSQTVVVDSEELPKTLNDFRNYGHWGQDAYLQIVIDGKLSVLCTWGKFVRLRKQGNVWENPG